MKEGDFAGYVYHADVWCGECLPTDQESAGPNPNEPTDDWPLQIHEWDSEWDHPVNCNCCGRFVPTRLTTEGVRYLVEELLPPGPGDDTEYQAEWRDYFKDSIDDFTSRRQKEAKAPDARQAVIPL